ncbi:MAG: acetyl-CoA acetyltransferase [Hyphomonadaceae bacterium]
MTKGSMPVLVGVGQAVSHWDGADGLHHMPTTLGLGGEAVNTALENSQVDDVSALIGTIDTLAMVRTMEDSIPGLTPPFGRCNNLPAGVAKAIGAEPAHLIYSDVGGQSPQSLVNELMGRIYSGESECALLAGAENIGAQKVARKRGLTPNLGIEIDADMEDRGLGPSMLTRREAKHGLVTPAYFYALFENAIAHRKGRTLTEHRVAMATLFSKFSDVAADNPFAQFPQTRSVEFLATPSRENYAFADPFLKWHIAQDAVNQAAAVLLMSEEKADALGVPSNARIYLHGAGEAADSHISERPQLDGSWAMEVALTRALDQAGKTADDIEIYDLYSCFPCAVFSSTSVLGIDWQTDPRALTQTGGLPFFGGPGNNYSLHGIASTIDALRAAPEAFGLVLANGGWMTKEAAGIYSSARPDQFTPAEAMARADKTVELVDAPDAGTIETYTVVNGRNGAASAIIFGRNGKNKRFLASSSDAETLVRMTSDSVIIGRRVDVTTKAEVNTFSFA